VAITGTNTFGIYRWQHIQRATQQLRIDLGEQAPGHLHTV